MEARRRDLEQEVRTTRTEVYEVDLEEDVFNRIDFEGRNYRDFCLPGNG